MIWFVTAAGLAAEICFSSGTPRRQYRVAFDRALMDQMERRVGAVVSPGTPTGPGHVVFTAGLAKKFLDALGMMPPADAAMLVVARSAAEAAEVLVDRLGENAAGSRLVTGDLQLRFEQVGSAVKYSGRLNTTL